MRAQKKITITDIAKETGLSISTISRVLNEKSKEYRISKQTEQKVIATVKRLNYVPNYFAANLKSGKSKTIAIIVPSLSNPFYTSIISELNVEIRKSGYTTIIAETDEDADIEKLELQQMTSRNIEGIIIVPCRDQSDHIKKLHDQGLPIVCIDRYFENLNIPYVSVDNYDGAYTATNHLIENGHSKIVCIQGIQVSLTTKLRVKGFEDAMQKVGFKDYSIVGDDFTSQNGYLETKLLINQKKMPTAIFTLNNTIALGSMKALKDQGLRIPQDISLITFDDQPFMDYFETPLTCIAQPISDISKIAIKFLFARINNLKENTNQVLLKPEIKFKKSVKNIQ